MSERIPSLSLGLPVYNGGVFFREAVESLLGQTFADFELIISDNASTDATEQVARDLAAADRRIRYVRNARNIGGGRNNNQVFQLARAPFFKWHTHDDYLAPDFLERCVAVLRADEAVALCHSKAKVVGEEGQVLQLREGDPRTQSHDPSERFRGTIDTPRFWPINCIFGVFRTDLLRKFGGLGLHAGADRVLLTKVSLHGRFHELPEYLYFHREHSGRSVHSQAWWYVHGSPFVRLMGRGPLPPAEWWDPALYGKIVFPDWRILQQYAEAIANAPLTTEQRARCSWHLARWAAWDSPRLLRDMIVALDQSCVRPLVSRRQQVKASA